MFGEVFESLFHGVGGVLFHGVGGVSMFGDVFESWFHGVGGVLFHGVGGVMMLDRLPRSRWAVWWRDGVRTRLSSAAGGYSNHLRMVGAN